MLLLTKSIEGAPVMSLQTGGKLGEITVPIIDPRNLKITAYHVAGPRIHEESVVHTSDIREIGTLGVIVNDAGTIMPIDDGLVRLEEVRAIKFKLIGKPVVDDSGKKLGKVSDYAVDSDDFMVMKLHVAQSVMKNLSSSALIIDRSQIIDVTDTTITVRSGTVTQQKGLAQALNPFRRSSSNLSPSAE